jgi:hypothetical protein
MNTKVKRALLGILTANLVALALMLVTAAILRLLPGDKAPGMPSNNPGNVFILSFFVLIPILMGLILAYFWKDLKLSGREKFGFSTLNLLVALLLCMGILREGVICIVMALPLVILFLWIGFAVGNAVFSRGSRPLQLTIAPLLLVGIVADVLTVRGYDGQVTDTMTIQAPARDVWRYIIDYPAITKQPDYWLWRIGLPAPVQSTATGHQVGAIRRCVFTGNIAFDERIAELQPERQLTFDITSQPKDPEVIGHFVLRRGRFLLHDNGNGTTTVIGTSWYTLNVHPAAYYDLWVQSIVRHVHLRVMEHIKALAEADNGVERGRTASQTQ